MFTDDIHFHLHAMKLFNEALRDIFKEKKPNSKALLD